MSEQEPFKRWIDPKGLHALRTRSRRKEPVWIAEQVRDWLKARHWRETLETALDPVGWTRVAPAHLHPHTRVAAVREGVLWIEARSPVWVQEVVLRRDDLLRGLRSHQPSGSSLFLSDLRVRLGVFRSGSGHQTPVTLPPLSPDGPAVRSALTTLRTSLPDDQGDHDGDLLRQMARARASYERLRRRPPA